MPEPKLVEAVARALRKATYGTEDGFWNDLDRAHAALDAIRNHTFGETVILANGTDLVAKLPGDVPQTVLRALIDLAMAEGPALASPEEGREP